MSGLAEGNLAGNQAECARNICTSQKLLAGVKYWHSIRRLHS